MASDNSNSTGLSRTDLATQLRKQLNSEMDLEHRHTSRMRFSPSLSYGRHFGPPEPTAKQAAVMILMVETVSGWAIPLTVRPQHLPDHPGQISLPGGRLESGETHLEAACREFVEELGTTSFPGDILGELRSIYVYNSDYCVRPFVAMGDEEIKYVPCEREVSRVVHLPLENLLDDTRLIQQNFHRGQASWHATVIQCEDTLIWGATAIILGEFARIYQSCLSQ